MDFNNENKEKENASWYVEEPNSGKDNKQVQEDNPVREDGSTSGGNEGRIPGGFPENAADVKRIFIHIGPNTMLISVSMMLGIIAIIGAAFSAIYLPLICGGISIIMAIQSRDADGTIDKKALIGILLSSLAIVVDIAVVTTSVYSVFHDPEQYAAFNEMFKNVYGQDFDTFTSNSIQVWQ
ncbi:MAG: hypothetical protein J5509_11160 [Lachnospiraceae bacterium]|nr:hypothetical protein [Lachnospiraceae bacterium]